MYALQAVTPTRPGWLVLDGALDYSWADNIHSVLGASSRVMTLASNERIDLRSASQYSELNNSHHVGWV